MKTKLTEEDVINWWLEKYHNTNLTEILKTHPEWEDNPREHTAEFYRAYAVSQEQHDEWHKWMIDAIAKEHGMSKKFVKRHSWAVYLNCSPSVK